MLSSLAVIQPGNERFSGVCFSSRAPFAEVGLRFCAGILAATAWDSGTCSTSKQSCWEWCCLCCQLNCISSSQDLLKWIQCCYRLQGLENEIWFYLELILPGWGQKQMDDFANESSSASTFKDWLLGQSGNPVLVDISLSWVAVTANPGGCYCSGDSSPGTGWGRFLESSRWLCTVFRAQTRCRWRPPADGLKPAHWPGLPPRPPKIFENLQWVFCTQGRQSYLLIKACDATLYCHWPCILAKIIHRFNRKHSAPFAAPVS